MRRKTITLHDEIFRGIQGIRTSLIRSEGVPLDDMSFTLAVNMILLGGIVGSDEFSDETRDIIKSFLVDQKEALERASLKDMEYERMMKKLFE